MLLTYYLLTVIVRAGFASVFYLPPGCLLQVPAGNEFCNTCPRCISPQPSWRSGCSAFNSLPPSVHPQSTSNASAAGSQCVIGRARS